MDNQNQDPAVQVHHDGQQQQQQPAPANPSQAQTPARRAHYVRPRAHVTEAANEFRLQVEMPGVRPDGLEVTFENGELVLTGHRAPLPAEDDAEFLYRESRPADFRRVFEVDPSIDAIKIQARLEQGVLTLVLPKAEAARARRVEVQHVRG